MCIAKVFWVCIVFIFINKNFFIFICGSHKMERLESVASATKERKVLYYIAVYGHHCSGGIIESFNESFIYHVWYMRRQCFLLTCEYCICNRCFVKRFFDFLFYLKYFCFLLISLGSSYWYFFQKKFVFLDPLILFGFLKKSKRKLIYIRWWYIYHI